VTTTTNLRTPTRARWYDFSPPVAATICIFLLLAGGLIVGRIRSMPSVAAVPTPALPIVIIATQPAIVPTAAPVQVAAQLPRFVVCYDQPVNGAVLGPIPAPDASAIVARYGNDWVMTPWNGGYCWLHAADVGLPEVADLRPTEAPAVIYVASQPQAAPTPAYEPMSAAQELVSRAPVVEAVPIAAPAVVRADDFIQPDPKAKCQFIGCL
jgi:hypothetical protein